MNEHERNLAIREGAQNAASHEYFSARSESFDTRITRAIFESGFVRGYDAATAPLLERIAELEAKLEQQDAHPVAWRHSKTFCLYETEHEVELADGDEWAEPLYTHPAPKQDAQPVAYMTEDGRVSAKYTVETSMPNAVRNSFTIPLYTHPAPKVPLTDEQIGKASPVSELMAYGFGMGVRFAESAHGITGDKP